MSGESCMMILVPPMVMVFVDAGLGPVPGALSCSCCAPIVSSDPRSTRPSRLIPRGGVPPQRSFGSPLQFPLLQ